MQKMASLEKQMQKFALTLKASPKSALSFIRGFFANLVIY
jgi:hypothetical protein